MPDGDNPLSRVKSAIRRQRSALIIFSSLVNLLMLVTAVYMLQIYDRVLTSGSYDTLIWLTLIAVFILAVYGFLEYSRRLIVSRISGHIESELGPSVLRLIMMKLQYGEEPEAGPRDVTEYRGYYRGDTALAFLDVPWTPIFILFVAMLHPVLGIIGLAGALVLLSSTLANDLLTRKRQKQSAAEARAAHEAALRYIDAGETIGPLGMTSAIFDRWKAWHNKSRGEQQELVETTSVILSFTRAFRMFLQIAILGTGAFLVLQGQLTAGAMIAASIVTSRAVGPVERLTSAWRSYVTSKAAAARIEKLFEASGGASSPLELPRPKGKVDVEDLHMNAPGTTERILLGVDFSIEAGEVCAIVGHSGAGKSSLCRALVGAWKPTAGHVRLDGADIHHWDSEKLGPHIGYLPQRVELFPGTIAENIARFGEIDSDAIIKAATMADVHDLVLKLPQGYETEVGRRADRLSYGQRQRIALARALYGAPSYIVLDEPNSNLDRDGDVALNDAIAKARSAGSTIIVVSHRAEVLKAADKILVLNEGKVGRFGAASDMLKPVAENTGKGVAQGSGSRTVASPVSNQVISATSMERPNG